MKRIFKKLIIIISVTVLFSGCEFGEKNHNKPVHAKHLYKKHSVQDNIQTYLEKQSFNGTVTIIKKDKPFLNLAQGYENFKGTKLLNNKSMFLIGSANKMLTGAIVYDLVKAKKININAPVNQYIANFGHADITINDLLKHESGIEKYNHELQFSGLDGSVNNIINGSFNPGFHHRFFYCDANYILLAKIIENVTHQSFEKNITSKIFKPLKLNNSMFYNNAKLNRYAVDGMIIDKGQLKQTQPYGLDKFYGAGNIYMSSADFAKVIHSYVQRNYFNFTQAKLPKYEYGYYNKNGFKRTRGYFFGSEVIAWFNKDKVIVLSSNKVDTSDYKKNEKLVKEIYNMVK